MKTIKFVSKRQIALFRDIMGTVNIFVPKLEIGQLVHFDLITDRSQIENDLSNGAICNVIWYKNNALMMRKLPFRMIGVDGNTDIPDTAVVVFYPIPYPSDSSALLRMEIMYRYIPIVELRKMELWRPSLTTCNDMVKFLTDIGIGVPEVLPEPITPPNSETQPLCESIGEIPILGKVGSYSPSLSESELNRLVGFANREHGTEETDKNNGDPLVRLAEFISHDLGITVDDHVLKYYLLGGLSLLEDRQSKKNTQ